MKLLEKMKLLLNSPIEVICFSFIVFVFLNLALNLFCSSPPSSDPTPTDDRNVDTDIVGIAKDTATRSTRLMLMRTHKEVAKKAAAEAGNLSTGGIDGILVAGVLGANPAMTAPVASKATVEHQPSISKGPPARIYLKVGDNLFVSIPGTTCIGAQTKEGNLDEDILTATGLKTIDEQHAIAVDLRKRRASRP